MDGKCREESSIPHALPRLSHLSDWNKMYSVEKASLEGEQPGVDGPLQGLICSSVFGLNFFFVLS